MDRRVSLGETAFILNYKGNNIEVVLSKVTKESTTQLVDGLLYVTWALERITPDSLDDVSNNEIIDLVKEALSVYGIRGVKTSVPFEEIIVNCKF